MKQLRGFTTALSSLESMHAGGGSGSAWTSHARLGLHILPPPLPESFSTNIHFLSGAQLSLSAIQFHARLTFHRYSCICPFELQFCIEVRGFTGLQQNQGALPNVCSVNQLGYI